MTLSVNNLIFYWTAIVDFPNDLSVLGPIIGHQPPRPVVPNFG